MNAEGKYFPPRAAVAGSLLSLPALLAASFPVRAADLTVSSPRTTAVVTSNIDGTGRGNVTVNSGASITVTTGAAVTLDSSNTVTNAGTITNSGESFAIGARITTTAGDLNGGFTTSGAITLPGPAATSTLANTTVTDTGIQLDGANIFHGSVTQSTGGTISVAGNGSYGIAVNGRLDGSIVNNGTITMSGNAAWGVSTTAAITGGIINAGTITGAGQGTTGIYAGANIGGAFVNTGSISTGTTAGANVATNPLLPGGRAVWLAGNAGGILLEGNGVTAAQTTAGAVGNGLTDSSLSVTGGAEALFVGQGGQGGYHDISIGKLASDPNGASLLIRGNVTSTAASSVTSVRAINLTGITNGGVDYHTTFAGGVNISGGEISATGIDATVNAIRIGELTTIPSFVNSGSILAQARDSSEDATTGVAGYGGGDASGVLIDARGNLATFTNSGAITADGHGATQAAYGVQDNSGTLTTVVNSGSVSATVHGTGAALAFDLSHGASAITFTNSGSIIGDVVLGPGNNKFTSTGGGITGALRLSSGDDTVAISNTLMTGNIDLAAGHNTLSLANSTLNGGVLSDNGTAALTVTGSTLSIPATSSVHITNGSVSGGSTLTFNVNSTAGLTGGIKADGALTIGAGTIINTTLSGPVTDRLTATLIQAQALTFAADLSTQQPASTIMYAKHILLADPNTLQLQVSRNTASQLGLSQNPGKVYEALIPALATDSDMSSTLGALTVRSDFDQALAQLMPDITDASRIAALNADSLTQTAIRRRLDGLLRDRDEPLGRYRSSYWAQTFGTYGTQSAQGATPGFRVISGGLAAGIDGEISNGVLGGLSLSQTEGYTSQPNNPGHTQHIGVTAFDLYSRYNLEPLYIQAIAGYAYDTHSSQRDVAFQTIDRTAVSDWTGNQVTTAVDVGTDLPLGASSHFTPYLRGAYARIFQQAHKETGAGDGVDLTYSHATTTSLRAGGGFSAEYQAELGDLSVLGFEARGDYAHEFKSAAPVYAIQFNAGTTPFSLTGLAPAAQTVSGGVGASWKKKFSSWNLDYDATKAGGYLGHSVTLTYRERF